MYMFREPCATLRRAFYYLIGEELFLGAVGRALIGRELGAFIGVVGAEWVIEEPMETRRAGEYLNIGVYKVVRTLVIMEIVERMEIPRKGLVSLRCLVGESIAVLKGVKCIRQTKVMNQP